MIRTLSDHKGERYLFKCYFINLQNRKKNRKKNVSLMLLLCWSIRCIHLESANAMLLFTNISYIRIFCLSAVYIMKFVLLIMLWWNSF